VYLTNLIMMRSALLLGFFLVVPSLTGCQTSQSVLDRQRHDGPPIEYTLQVPPAFEVVSVDFDVAYASTMSGGGGVGGVIIPVTGSSQEQAFVKVNAVDRATGQRVLLVYGDLRRRSEPLAIIRLAQEVAAEAR
jgi:hypothetical protein